MSFTFSNFGSASYNSATKEFSLTTATSNSLGIIYTQMSPATNYMSSVWCWTPANSNINFNYQQFIGDTSSNIKVHFNNSNVSLEVCGSNVATSNINSIVRYNNSNNIMTNVLNETVYLKFNNSNVFNFTSNGLIPSFYGNEPFIQISSSNVPESSNYIHKVKSFGVQNNFAIINHTLFNSNVNINGTLYASNIRSPSVIQGQSFSTMNVLNGVTLSNINNGGYGWLSSNNKDESATLSNFIYNSNNFTKFGVENDAHKHIVVETKTGFLYLDGGISLPDNISLEFKCMVAAGQNFQIQLTGAMAETPSSSTISPVIVGDVYEDDTSIIIDTTGKASIASWTVGTYIAIRSIALNARQDNQIAGITNLGSNKYLITLQTPISGFDIIGGGYVKAYISALLTSPVSRGAVMLNVSTVSGYTAGAYIAITDRRNAGDYVGNTNLQDGSTTKRLWYSSNKFKFEIRQVLKVDTVSNTIVLESPLSNDYDTTNAYILLMLPAYNTTIKGLRFFYVQEPSYPRNNKHGIYFDSVVNSHIEDIVYSDSFPNISSNVQFPNINHLINVRESYNCRVTNVNATRKSPLYSDSGNSYGITSYYNSFCYFDNLQIHGTFRHNILLQSANKTFWNNVVLSGGLISMFDMHGLNERDNVITNLYVDGSRGQTALGVDNATPVNSTQAFIRLGNETHPTGSSHNLFDGVTLKYGLPSNNIVEVYGINLIPRCIGNVFRNVTMENIDTAIALYDHPKARLNTNMVSTSNIFDNFIIKDCNRVIDINGADNIDGSYAKTSATVASVPTSSSITISTTASISTYHDAYVGWILQHAGNNYTITAYNASTKLITISSTFITTPTVGNSVTIRDSLTRSINPIREFTFTNSKILNSSNVCNLYSCTGVRSVNNYFNSNIGLRYTYDMLNASNVSILDNNIEYTKRFVQWSNVTNANIVGNQLTYITESNIINDVGGNSNILWKHNHANGFAPTMVVNPSTSFVYDITRLGYSNQPHQIGGISINNSNGAVGIGTTNLTGGNALHFNDDVANRKIVLATVAQNSDHRFFGFGYNSNILRYQVGSNEGAHVFYLQSNTNSIEYMRINNTGVVVNGNVSATSFTTTGPINNAFVNASNVTASNVYATNALGVGTTNPSYQVDVIGTGMRLQGGTGATPTTFYLNSTGAGNTTSVIQFVNSGHQIACTDTSPYQGLDRASDTSGHNIFYISSGHVFSGNVFIGSGNNQLRIRPGQVWNGSSFVSSTNGASIDLPGGGEITFSDNITFYNSVKVNGANVIELGQNVSGKEASAGKIGYQTFTSGALDIVGAGTTSGYRSVKLWDNVNVNGNLTVNGSIQFGSGTTLLTQKIVNYTVGMGEDGLNTFTVTHNLGTSSYNVFFSHEDTQSPIVDDVFLIKVLSKGTNTVNIGISRRTNAYWNRSWNLVCLFVVS